MKEAPSAPIYICSVTPYLLIAWGFTELTHGDSKVNWAVLGVLFLVRLFEMLGSVLSWRLHGRKIMVDYYLELFQTNNFPKCGVMHDDLSNYLSRIESPYSEYPATLKVKVKEMMDALDVNRIFGILTYSRVNSAAEAALDIYSPRSEAPRNLACLGG